MLDVQNKTGLIVTGVLLLIFIVGATILGIRLIGHQPREITLTNITPPDYTYEVSIEGAVVNPGSYPAAAGDTLLSLINSAGLKKSADTGVISIQVSDTAKNTGPQKVNINTAPVWMLDALPGIGPGRAEAIVEYRHKNGFFKGINDIMKVEGMGKSVFDKIKDFITTGNN